MYATKTTFFLHWHDWFIKVQLSCITCRDCKIASEGKRIYQFVQKLQVISLTNRKYFV